MTGLYTSPHILDFRERMIVNGEMISKKFVIDFTNRINPLIRKIEPSFFEVTTAMAFEYFSKKKVEYAVIETGLGGRLDSTNVLMPELSIITSIAHDHHDFLGNTITKIAYEKAGIIKKNIPVVTGKLSETALKEVRKKCRETESKLIDSSKKRIKVIRKNDAGLKFELNKTKYTFPVIGDYQLINLRTSLTAIDALSKSNSIQFAVKEIQAGLSNIKENSNFHGRFEVIKNNPKIVIDVSHNEQALENISANLKYFKYEKLTVIFGMMKDKNYKKGLDILSKLKAKIILTRPLYPRAEEPENLYKVVKSQTKFIPIKNLHDAFRYSLSHTGNKDLILVTGSFFLVSEFLEIYNKHYK